MNPSVPPVHGDDDMPAAHSHLDDLTVAAFLDGALSRPARARAVRHLESCTACREEIGDVQRLLRPRRPSSSWWWGGAAAAAALLLWLGPFGVNEFGAREARDERGAGAYGGDRDVIDRERAAPTAPEIDEPLRAASGSLITDGDRLVLIWHAAARGASYNLVVQDEAGGVRYAASTTDTAHAVPRAQLGTNDRLYWRVHAQLLDGRERSTGAQLLRLAGTPSPTRVP
jgi:hypothetical protein